MSRYTDWTTGEPVEKEWAMTDPALRALEPMTADEIERTRQQLRRTTFRANTPAMGLVADHLLATVDALAAAEAAPLDVERLARALSAQMTWAPDDFTEPREYAARIAREYAALRSPDTETGRCEHRDITRSEKSGRVSIHRCTKPVARWAMKRIGELGGAFCQRHAIERVR